MLSLMEVYSMTDLRALITQLCDELDHNRQCLLDDRRLTHPLSDKARAALAKTDGPDVSGDREPASVAKQYSGELSPAVRSVFESFNSKFEWVEDGVPGPQFSAIAAALRAAVDQVVPEYKTTPGGSKIWPSEPVPSIRAGLLAITAELESAND